jgi:hypothetical protein
VTTVASGILRCSICLYIFLSHLSTLGIRLSGSIFVIVNGLYSIELILELFSFASAVDMFSHIVVSVSDGSASNAANRFSVVHSQTSFIFEEVIVSMCEIECALAGTDVVAIGPMVLAAIHALANTFLTALLVFSTNF